MDWKLALIRLTSENLSSFSTPYPVTSMIFSPRITTHLIRGASYSSHYRVWFIRSSSTRERVQRKFLRTVSFKHQVQYFLSTSWLRSPVRLSSLDGQSASEMRHSVNINSFPIESILLLCTQIENLEFHLDIASFFVSFHIPRSFQLPTMYTNRSLAVLSTCKFDLAREINKVNIGFFSFFFSLINSSNVLKVSEKTLLARV